MENAKDLLRQAERFNIQFDLRNRKTEIAVAEAHKTGFETFLMYPGQEGSGTRVQLVGNHEARDVTAAWSYESDRNAPSTFSNAMQWLEKHYKEDFFLLVDTWDPHEPWDAPAYFTEMYMSDYDGELVQPPYGFWYDTPGMTEDMVQQEYYCSFEKPFSN